MEEVDVIVVGAGAAGMMCAIEAARRGRRVVVLDHARTPGEKIRISGGGRCNFTNIGTEPGCFLSANPRFAISALSRFTPRDFIARVDAAGIAWHEKTLGQLFCDGSARQVVAMLTGQMAEAGAELRLGAPVRSLERGDRFRVGTEGGVLVAERLVVATGGKSIPKMGATGFAYDLARRFGLPMVETRPGLVPFTFAEEALGRMRALAGVSVRARAAANGASFEEGLLFTHRGLSGPSILQISSYWREGQGVGIDLLPGADIAALMMAQRQASGRVLVQTALARHLPERLAGFILDGCGISGRLADQSNAAIGRIADAVHRWSARPIGTEGYRTAEVTLGGIDTAALDARTMEARAVPGLHVIGEAVDVTGWLGGYNFQWAWASGWAAGQVV